MREIDLNDLSFAAKLKSDLMYLLWRLEHENHCSGESLLSDFRITVCEFIEFESFLQSSFTENKIT